MIVWGGFGIALGLLGGNVALSYWMIRSLVTSVDWVSHSHLVSTQLSDLEGGLVDVSNARGYALSDEPRYVERVAAAEARVATARQALRLLVSDNPLQEERLAQLEPLIDDRVALARATLVARQADGYASPRVVALSREASGVMDQIRRVFGSMVDEERSLLARRVAAQRRTQRNTLLVNTGGAALAALLVGLAMLTRERDLRRRRRADRALRTQTNLLQSVLDNMTESLFVVDRHGQLLLTNRAAQTLFGAALDAPASEFTTRAGLRWSDGSTPVDAADLPIARALRGEDASRADMVLRGPQGDDVWLSTAARAILDEEGQRIGALAVCSDVTLRRQNEAALREARDVAEAASHAKSEFLANMSHEIRTPINGVIGMTELVLDTAMTPDQRRCLDLVHQSGVSLLAIIDDILDFSKIEAGKLDLAAEPFELNAVLDVALKGLAIRAHRVGLELAGHIAPDVPVHLVGDAGRLGQILLNLVGNAVKFTERGGVTVDVALEATDANGAVLRFQVRDTGIGILRARQTAIFDAFVQADTSTTRRYGGTGLGLGISARLVKLMGGRIWVDSEPGAGSTFCFTARFGRAAEAAAVRERAPAALRGWRTLVVDDHDTSRTVLVELLERWGLRATGVCSAAEARAAVSSANGDPYRLALVDVGMPEKDGWSFAAWARAHAAQSELAVIILSSAMEADGVHRARALGAVDQLLKPVGQQELLGSLTSLAAQGVANPGAVPPPTTREGATRQLNVLVAEDNPVNQELVRRLLGRAGCRYTLARTGREAVEHCQSEVFDLVLMDVQMPEMDGFAATAVIRTDETARGCPRLPIIALTAHAMNGDRERCLAAGMDGYLTKPLRRAELFALLDRYAAETTHAAGECAIGRAQAG